MDANIIVTIGEEAIKSNPEMIIEKMIDYDVTYFRFNLSRYQSINDFEDHVNIIKRIRKCFENKIQIIIDLPYPNEKIRVFIPNALYRDINQGEHIIIESNNSSTHIEGALKCNVNDLDELIEADGQSVLYGDGEITFICESRNHVNKSVELIAEQGGKIFSRKAISFGKIVPSMIDIKEVIKKVLIIKPDAVAFSFVSSSEEIESATRLLEEKGVKIFSKIENENGAKRINEISKISDIIVARGDLLMNTKPNEFGFVQSKILENAKENHKTTAVATGILTSLAKQNIPTQAELVDLYDMKKANVDYVILNYGLVRSHNIERAIKLIKAI